jgi:hypothetical protein
MLELFVLRRLRGTENRVVFVMSICSIASILELYKCNKSNGYEHLKQPLLGS